VAHPPRVHYQEPGQRFALCGRATSRTTRNIQLYTCVHCRELHRQHAEAAGGHRRRMWSEHVHSEPRGGNTNSSPEGGAA
jgi:hypothetical protein